MILIKLLHKYLLLFIPFLLITGPFLPDLSLSLSSFLFLFLTIKEKKFYYYKNIFFIIFIIWCLYCILISRIQYAVQTCADHTKKHYINTITK